MVDIRTNLLKNRRTLSEKDYQKERNLLKYSVLVSVIVVVGVVSLSVWNLFLTKKMSGVEKAITAASKEMEGLVQANAKQVYLKSRLSLITDFLSTRVQARESLQKVLSTEIGGAHIAAVAFVDESTLLVQYSADQSSALTSLLTYYEQDTDYFIQVTSGGVSRSKDGKYQLAMELTLPKGDKK